VYVERPLRLALDSSQNKVCCMRGDAGWTCVWAGRDGEGRAVGAGVYFVAPTVALRTAGLKVLKLE
jgi:hypothetical protein